MHSFRIQLFKKMNADLFLMDIITPFFSIFFLRELTKTFINFPKPVIAAVSGAAVGMGLSLLSLCDVVYASDKASFYLPYSQLSQTPEGCASFTLPLTLGLPSVSEL